MKKKILFFIGIFAFGILLTGCGEEQESKEVSICKNVQPKFESFVSDSISYDELYNHLKSVYDQDCTGENFEICSSIKSFLNNKYDSSSLNNETIKNSIKGTVNYMNMDCQKALGQ